MKTKTLLAFALLSGVAFAQFDVEPSAVIPAIIPTTPKADLFSDLVAKVPNTGQKFEANGHPEPSLFRWDEVKLTPNHYVWLNEAGEYQRCRNVSAVVLEMTPARMVVECRGNLNHQPDPARPSKVELPMWPTQQWREVYEIRDGKLVLTTIQRPAVTPTRVESTAWGKDDLAAK